MPMFYEKPNKMSIIKPGTELVIKRETEFLNHEQVPVIAYDQPIFAIPKYIQWS